MIDQHDRQDNAQNNFLAGTSQVVWLNPFQTNIHDIKSIYHALVLHACSPELNVVRVTQLCLKPELSSELNSSFCA